METHKLTLRVLVCTVICMGYSAFLWSETNIPNNNYLSYTKTLKPGKGTFLVATNKLDESSFRHTVIFLTHFSGRGATGIAINRSADIALGEAFPHEKQLSGRSDVLFLGGPVRTDAVFVLMQTNRPHAGMRKILDNIYFTVGLNAITHSLPNAVKGEHARAFMGYAGWAPGQLQYEIDRGDWLVIDAKPSIIFELDHEDIWKKLHTSWSGKWI